VVGKPEKVMNSAFTAKKTSNLASLGLETEVNWWTETKTIIVIFTTLFQL
jgi:hypothetical protein